MLGDGGGGGNGSAFYNSLKYDSHTDFTSAKPLHSSGTGSSLLHTNINAFV